MTQRNAQRDVSCTLALIEVKVNRKDFSRGFCEAKGERQKITAEAQRDAETRRENRNERNGLLE